MTLDCAEIWLRRWLKQNLNIFYVLNECSVLKKGLPYQFSGLLNRHNNGKQGLDSEWMRGEILNTVRVVYLHYFSK